MSTVFFFFYWLPLSASIATFWLDLQCPPFKSIHSSSDLLTSVKWSMYCWADSEFWRQRSSTAFQLEFFWLEGWVIKLVTCGNILILWYIFRNQFFFSETLCHDVLFRISSLPRGTRTAFNNWNEDITMKKKKRRMCHCYAHPSNFNRDSRNTNLWFSWYLNAIK